jgi:hypothetical protein
VKAQRSRIIRAKAGAHIAKIPAEQDALGIRITSEVCPLVA